MVAGLRGDLILARKRVGTFLLIADLRLLASSQQDDLECLSQAVAYIAWPTRDNTLRPLLFATRKTPIATSPPPEEDPANRLVGPQVHHAIETENLGFGHLCKHLVVGLGDGAIAYQ